MFIKSPLTRVDTLDKPCRRLGSGGERGDKAGDQGNRTHLILAGGGEWDSVTHARNSETAAARCSAHPGSYPSAAAGDSSVVPSMGKTWGYSC